MDVPKLHEISSLEKKLPQTDSQIRRVMQLYRLGTIDEDLIHIELVSLQEQTKAIADNLENVRLVQGSLEVTDKDIWKSLKTLRKRSITQTRK
jgi:hypothetical protein